MIKLIKSTFYKESTTKKALSKFLESAAFLSFSDHGQQFEQNFAKWQGREDCVLVNSGSSANLAVIQALINLGHIKAGDQVGFSAITWSTNVMPLFQLGLQPVPVDVELDTLNVSSKSLAHALSKHPIKVLFLTNLLGLCDDIDNIRDLCYRKHILLIEDNCESLGSVYQGKKLGNFGIASTFSFYVGHHLSTIEGGAICTDYDELGEALRIVRAHGWDRNLNHAQQQRVRKKHKINSAFYSRYTFYDLGYNLRPTEITGFLGNFQLQFADEIVKKRQQNFNHFAKEVYSNTKRFLPIKTSHLDTHSSFALPIICKTKTTRNQIVKRCAGKVEIRPIVGGNMVNQPFFQKYDSLGFSAADVPNAHTIHQKGLYMGNNPDLSKEDLQTMIAVLTKN